MTGTHSGVGGDAGFAEKLADAEQELERTREALAASERRVQIEREVAAAGAVDVETARLLTELAVADMDDADVSVAVNELRTRKPFLFRKAFTTPTAPKASGVMAPKRSDGGRSARLETARETARRTGDRGALLRYLKERRGG